jgi:hypothetical protein
MNLSWLSPLGLKRLTLSVAPDAGLHALLPSLAACIAGSQASLCPFGREARALRVLARARHLGTRRYGSEHGGADY